MTKPNPGDEIAIDAGSPHKVWHRTADAPWRMLDNVQSDLSDPQRFTIRHRGQSGTIYRYADDWQVEVVDDNESVAGMRRGRVVT